MPLQASTHIIRTPINEEFFRIRLFPSRTFVDLALNSINSVASTTLCTSRPSGRLVRFSVTASSGSDDQKFFFQAADSVTVTGHWLPNV